MGSSSSVVLNDLQRLIGSIILDDSPIILPSFHSTTVSDMEDILREGIIDTTECSVFREDLAYFFYGKPSYVVSQGDDKAFRHDLFMPGCFVVDTSQLPVHKIYPFDSGAFMSGRYKDYLPRNANISHYEVSPDIESIKKYINTFFKCNQNYLTGVCSVDETLLVNKTTQSLAYVLGAPGLEAFDERAGTLEILCKDEINLSSVLLAVIIPEPFNNNEFFMEFMSKNPKVRVLCYPVHYPLAPVRHNESIYVRCMDFYKEMGCLNV